MSTGSAQVVKRTCGVHTGEEIDMFCHTCDKTMCSKCAKEKHRSHEWDTLTKAVKEIRLQGHYRITEVKDTHILKLRQIMRDLRKAKTEASQTRLETTERVKRCKDKIIEYVNARAKEIVDFFESENHKVNENIDKELSAITKNIDTIELLIETFAQSMNSGSDHGIMELKESLETEINQFKTPDIDYLSKSSNFVEGMINTKIIETMFGFIQKKEVLPVPYVSLNNPVSVTVSKPERFVLRTNLITGISAISDTEAWIHRSKQTTNEMVTTKGKQIQQVDTGTLIGNFTVTNNGDTIYTDFDGCRIMRITCTGEKTTLSDTAPLHPWGISLSLYGDLLVTLMDNRNYNTDTNSQRLLQNITVAGEVTQIYQFDKDTHEQLFTLPYRVCQNYNTDICVVDGTTEDRGQVYILLQDGTVKYRYTGTGSQSKFDPTGVACDMNCNVLICDYERRIHFLHSSGQFLRFLITNQEGLNFPTSMCLYNDKLWIGSKGGVIDVYKYDF